MPPRKEVSSGGESLFSSITDVATPTRSRPGRAVAADIIPDVSISSDNALGFRPPVRTRARRDARQEVVPITQDVPISMEPVQAQDLLAVQDAVVDRKDIIERWAGLKPQIDDYEAVVNEDGSIRPADKRLRINDQDVMWRFEMPWAKKDVDVMFEGREGPQEVVMRGYGLGIKEEFVYNKMRTTGGTLTIIELNHDLFEVANEWARQRNEEILAMPYGPDFKIVALEGDADQVLAEKFEDGSIGLLFSDTHQLIPEERGINDILQPDLLVAKLKDDGKLSICAFHKFNQTGDLDERQRERLNPRFLKQEINLVEVAVHPDCEYLDGPRAWLPSAVFSKPIKAAALG